EGLQNGIGPNQVMKEEPAGTLMTLTAHVRIHDRSVAYRVYLYDDFAKVPFRNFNAQSARAMASWTIPPNSGARWQVTIDALTSDTRVFRAVPVTAP
ncbi:MAG: hypothetical protein VW362_09450, partial [Candidatus Nanopelagicales bacterium]